MVTFSKVMRVGSKVIIEKSHARWEILMKQKLRFGVDLGRLALLKEKIGPIMSNFLGQFFQVFMGQK